MKIKDIRPFYIFGVLVTILAASKITGYSFALNTTSSMPKGIYLVGPLSSPARGQVVSVCIPQSEQSIVYVSRGYIGHSKECSSGLPKIMKPIVGMPGDNVRLDHHGTWINGNLNANSRIYSTDSDGLPMSHLPLDQTFKLEEKHYFVLSNHAERSLDSRYYGPIQLQDMRARVWPILTF